MNDTLSVLPDITLHFNLKHPELEECYRMGYEGVDSLNEEDNPFPFESKAYTYWMDGWWDGFYDNPPAFYWDPVAEEVSMDELVAANDAVYLDHFGRFLKCFLEISGVLAVSAIVGYQLVELVA